MNYQDILDRMEFQDGLQFRITISVPPIIKLNYRRKVMKNSVDGTLSPPHPTDAFNIDDNNSPGFKPYYLEGWYEFDSSYSERKFVDLLARAALEVEIHEACEAVRLDGKLIMNPHRPDGVVRFIEIAERKYKFPNQNKERTFLGGLGTEESLIPPVSQIKKIRQRIRK